MALAADRLKELRESAVPKLSVRRVAASLGMPPSSYAFYEDPKKFKKRFLPIEIAQQLSKMFAQYGVEPAAIMALAGVEDMTASIEQPVAALPVQLVTMQVALPSEAALARMFEGLLLPLDLTRPKDEIAQLLARRLPTGFAQLRDLAPGHAPAAMPARGEVAPPPARDHRESPPPSRT